MLKEDYRSNNLDPLLRSKAKLRIENRQSIIIYLREELMILSGTSNQELAEGKIQILINQKWQNDSA